MRMKMTLRYAGNRNALSWFDHLYSLTVMSSDGRITDIFWEPGSPIWRLVGKENVVFNVPCVWLYDRQSRRELKTLDACCIIGLRIIDSDGNDIPVESYLGSVWCSECEFKAYCDHFSFVSDVSRNMYAYIRDALVYEDPSHERCVEEIERAAYESFADKAPSFVPDREDLRILRALAVHYPPVNGKTAPSK